MDAGLGEEASTNCMNEARQYDHATYPQYILWYVPRTCTRLMFVNDRVDDPPLVP